MGNDSMLSCAGLISFVEKNHKDLIFKDINFCPLCFKDAEGIPYTQYNEDKINQKRQQEPFKQTCDYLEKVSKDFFEKIKTYEIDNVYDFLKDEESNKCFHFYHEECKKQKKMKTCRLCENGVTVRNHYMFLDKSGLDYDMQLSHIHRKEFTHDVKLKRKDIKKKFHFHLKFNKEIPEEVRNKYEKRYEMEKFYGKVIPWSEYAEKEASFSKDKKARKEAYKESENKRKAKIAEKRQAVNFCPKCIKGCAVCRENKGDSQGIFAHPSCYAKYKDNRLCGYCGKKAEIGSLWQAHVCGSCSNKVGPYVCYYCRDKIEIDD